MQFQFGAFTLDTETRQLGRGGDPVHVSPKAFELLTALVEARPRALSKADLHDRLWPDTFVSDANLAILIREIRRALEDNARAPKFVRTLHGFGYAFSGAVVESAPPDTPRVSQAVTYWLIGRARKFELAEGRHLVGRSPEASVWLDVPGVSREHARIRIEGTSATLEDLGSTNGTFLGTERIAAAARLEDGNQIQFGPVVMIFRVWARGAGTKTEDLSEAASRPNSPGR